MEKTKFEPIAFTRTSDYIEEKIEAAILDGRLKLGDRLPTEKEMASQFGVSVVTLREALKALEIFGLIKKRKGQRGGIFVNEINNESIKASLGHFLRFKDLSPKHLLDVRKIIEPPVIKLAVKNITPYEIKKLEENISSCEEKIREAAPLFSEKDFCDVDEKNIDFHRLIAEGAHNPILSLTIDYVLDFIFDVEKDLLVPDINFCINAVKDHRNILDYLEQGDGERCEKEMGLHLKRIDEYLMCMEKRLYPSGDIIIGEKEVQKKESSFKKENLTKKPT